MESLVPKSRDASGTSACDGSVLCAGRILCKTLRVGKAAMAMGAAVDVQFDGQFHPNFEGIQSTGVEMWSRRSESSADDCAHCGAGNSSEGVCVPREPRRRKPTKPTCGLKRTPTEWPQTLGSRNRFSNGKECRDMETGSNGWDALVNACKDSFWGGGFDVGLFRTGRYGVGGDDGFVSWKRLISGWWRLCQGEEDTTKNRV